MKPLAAISTSLNKIRCIFLFLCFLFVFSLVGEEKDRTHPINEKCLSCHRIGSAYKGKFKINEKYFSASVHSHLKCTDCHQITLRDNEEDIPHEKDLPVVNCTSKCHREDQQIRPGLSPLYYSDGIHSRKALNGNKDVPLCIDCHGEYKIISPLDEEAPTSWKNVSNTCAACYIRPKIARKYDIPEDGIESFIKSSHGIAIDDGNKAAANCASCHGFHDIRPTDDHFSRVNPVNLTKTCGQENCHPEMTGKIANSRIHIDISQKKSGAPFHVQQALFLIVFITAVITVVLLVSTFIKKLNT